MGSNLSVAGASGVTCQGPTIWFAGLAPKKERNEAHLRQVTHLAIAESTFAPAIEYVRQQADSDISPARI